jgi:large subunit ribosomal protein L1
LLICVSIFFVENAVASLGRMSKARCDQAVELSIHIAVDPKQNDQMVRGIVSLAEGNGNHLRVLVGSFGTFLSPSQKYPS